VKMSIARFITRKVRRKILGGLRIRIKTSNAFCGADPGNRARACAGSVFGKGKERATPMLVSIPIIADFAV